MRFLRAGENGLLIELGSEIDPVINDRVLSIQRTLASLHNPAILEIVPAYSTLHIFFDPFEMSLEELRDLVTRNAETESNRKAEETAVLSVPVLYGGNSGPDIAFVARHAGLSEEELIGIHTKEPLKIYMLGFMPGFPYCGNPSQIRQIPRLEKPRTKVPRGSVGCAGMQTGIYPVESPGGWRLIGRTPVRVFSAARAQPFLFSPGDYIQFNAIDESEYSRIDNLEERGEYVPVISYENNVTAQESSAG